MKIIQKILVGFLALLFFSGASVQQFFQSLHQSLLDEKWAVSVLERAWADVIYKLEEALKLVFPNAAKFEEEVRDLTLKQRAAIEKQASLTFHKEFDKKFTFYKWVAKDGVVLGYVGASQVQGKWGAIEYAVGLNDYGEVTDVLVLNLTEKRGKPIREKKFLGQFSGKTINDPLNLKKDIRGVAGASISSQGMLDGVKKVLFVFNELYPVKEKPKDEE